MHLLVVEDDARLRRLLTRLLGVDRHVVEEASDGRTALELARMADGLDAIILDIGLPDRSGLEVARDLRSRGSSVPILMLTARDSIDDRVRGLDAGADDYLVKPFAYEELSARLRALGRRARHGTRKTAKLVNGPIILDEALREVTVGGRAVTLSPREFSLLECFLRHPGQALSRDQLLDAAWPYGVAVTPNTVDAYVHLLREKLGDDGSARIRTERGVGYRMLAPERPVPAPEITGAPAR
jgi:DNA-binding response OmpR family regulator